ncbi:MAG: hypothetical protein PHG29_11110 [Prolixibacteraceae bacterium]|nr:hypothetical protein [Prolixibacteraceae bacterium]
MRNIKFTLGFLSVLFVLLMLNLQVTATKTCNPGNNNQDKVFMAGAAKSNITPFLGGGIVGNFGNPPPAKHVHDELHAKCLALDDGKTKLMFIVVDIIGLNTNLTEEAKRIISEETGVPVGNVMISAIHTHSATSAQGVGDRRRKWTVGEPFDEYQKFVIRRLADVARIALNNLEPARIGWGSGNVPEHVFVRRWLMKPDAQVINPFGGQDKVRTNPGRNNPDLLKPAGKPDPEVFFISVQSTQGKPVALLANYGLHYVGGVPRNDISADYFAVFSDRIQELLKADRQDPPFVGIMSNGTSGNVNNVNFAGPAEKNEPYEKMRIVAEDVAREVFRAHSKVEFHDWVPLGAVQEVIKLEVRKPDQKTIAWAEDVLKRPDNVKPVHSNEDAYAERVLNLLDYPDQLDVVLQSFRIGDLGVVAIPFETFAETGMEIKEKSPFKSTFVIELANGYNGYLPTPEQHELGGYETWLSTNKVEKDASVKIVAKLLNQLSSLK